MRVTPTLVLLFAVPLSSSAIAETRGFVISGFNTAVYDNDGNCKTVDTDAAIKERLLREIGYSPEEARRLVLAGRSLVDPELEQKINEQETRRARVNGKPANAYNYPEAVPDPNVEMVQGKISLGFNLDGKIGPNDFEDPETHEKGIDNNLWRALGCMVEFKWRRPESPGPLYESYVWGASLDSMPAWIISISGASLAKDGPVTITFDRATRHPTRDATGHVLPGDTFVIDNGSRSHNVLQGHIHDGTLTIDPAPAFYLEGELPYHLDIDMQKVQLRLKFEANGSLSGYLGGYINWRHFSFLYTSTGITMADLIGIYWNLKKMADADPDPVTGANRRISTAFHVEAVPAYLARSDGTIIAESVRSAPVGASLVATNQRSPQ
jgi:hypothetical protein